MSLDEPSTPPVAAFIWLSWIDADGAEKGLTVASTAEEEADRNRTFNYTHLNTTWPGEWTELDWPDALCTDCRHPLYGRVWCRPTGEEVAMHWDHFVCPACGAVHQFQHRHADTWVIVPENEHLTAGSLARLRRVSKFDHAYPNLEAVPMLL